MIVPPNICGFVAILVASTCSDKVRARGPFLLGGCVLAIAGYVMLLVAESPAVKYGGTFLIAVGVYPGTPMSELHSLLSSDTNAAQRPGLASKQLSTTLRSGYRDRPASYCRQLCRIHRHICLFIQGRVGNRERPLL